MQAFVPKKELKIGEGSYGTLVYVGVMKDGSEVAVKRMVAQRSDNIAENEKEIMSLIKTDNSPFIVSYRHFHCDDDFIYLIVDLCEETLGELFFSRSVKHLQHRGPGMIKEVLWDLNFFIVKEFCIEI